MVLLRPWPAAGLVAEGHRYAGAICRARQAKAVTKQSIRSVIQMDTRSSIGMNMPVVLRRSLFLSILSAPAAWARSPIWLVTEREAGLTPSDDAAATRGIMRGPSIRYVSPRTSVVSAGQPFWLRVEFAPRGGTKINRTSTRVVLLRGGHIDVTSRLGGFFSEEAIDVPEALAPIGLHSFRIDVSDDQGRQSSSVVQVDVR